MLASLVERLLEFGRFASGALETLFGRLCALAHRLRLDGAPSINEESNVRSGRTTVRVVEMASGSHASCMPIGVPEISLRADFAAGRRILTSPRAQWI